MKPIVVLLLAVACSAPTKTVPLLTIPTTFQKAEDVLGGTWVDRGFAAMLLPVRVTGSIQRTHGKTACQTPLGVLPYVTWTAKEPRVGELISVEWTTLAIAAPREWPVVILANRAASSADIGPLGTLLVDLHDALWLAPGPAGSLLERRPEDAGRIRLNWTPTPDQVGQVWYFQCICFGLTRDIAPAGGMLLSPGLRAEIGSARQ